MQPLASLDALSDPIYEAFYGLSEQPFAITTDPKFLYLSAAHKQAFSELLNGLRRREGLVLLTGETGTGKTTLCRAVVEALGPRTFSATILNPYMTGAEVFRMVLRDFGLVTHEELRRGALASADVPQLLDTIEGFLQSLVPLQSHAIVIIDEAQSLTPQVLDQIRMLTGLEYDGLRLVQVVLCGQPGLLETLNGDSMHALNERITRRVALAPLALDEVDPYIQHRLAIAGGADAVKFDEGASRLIGELAHGLPRRINVLCDRALQEGRIEGVSTITADLVKRAARAVAGAHEPPATGKTIPAGPPAAVAVPSFLSTDAEADSQPGVRSWAAVGAVIFAVLAVLLGGYGYYAYSTLTEKLTLPTVAAPARRFATPAGPLPVPSDDEIRAMLVPARPPAAAAPSFSPSFSGQSPDNRN